MMTRDMRIAKWAVWLTILGFASCGSVHQLPSDFAESVANAPAAAPSRMLVQGGEILEIAVPLTDAALPEAARVAIDAVQPAGKTVAVERVWSERGAGFGVTKIYDDGVAGRRRSVVVDATGNVLERSHEIEAGRVPPVVMQRIQALRVGDIRLVEAVQYRPGDEHYRFLLQTSDGIRTLAQCRVDSSDLHFGRVIGAEITAWR